MIGGSWSASTGTLGTSATDIGVNSLGRGGSIGTTYATVTCTAGGAAVLVSPSIFGRVVRIDAKPASDNAATGWTIAISDTTSGASLGRIVSLASPASATTAEAQRPALPLMCNGTLTFTLSSFTASKACTIYIYAEAA